MHLLIFWLTLMAYQRLQHTNNTLGRSGWSGLIRMDRGRLSEVGSSKSCVGGCGLQGGVTRKMP